MSTHFRRYLADLSDRFAATIDLTRKTTEYFEFKESNTDAFVQGYEQAIEDLQRKYLKPGQKAPKGRKTGVAKDGRAYYETLPRAKKSEGSSTLTTMVKITHPGETLPRKDNTEPAGQATSFTGNLDKSKKTTRMSLTSRADKTKGWIKGDWNKSGNGYDDPIYYHHIGAQIKGQDTEIKGTFVITPGSGTSILSYVKDGKSYPLAKGEGGHGPSVIERLQKEAAYYDSEPDIIDEVIGGKRAINHIWLGEPGDHKPLGERSLPKTKLISPKEKDEAFYNKMDRRKLEDKYDRLHINKKGYEMLRDKKGTTPEKKKEYQDKIDAIQKQEKIIQPLLNKKRDEETETVKTNRSKIDEHNAKTAFNSIQVGKYLKLASKGGVLPKDKLDEIGEFIGNDPSMRGKANASKLSPDMYKLNMLWLANNYTTSELRKRQASIKDQIKIAYDKYDHKDPGEEGTRVMDHLDAMLKLHDDAVGAREFEFEKEEKKKVVKKKNSNS